MKLVFSAYEDLASYHLLSTPAIRYDGAGKCTYASFSVEGESPFTDDAPLTGEIRFMSDDDMDLNTFDVGSFLRFEIHQNTETVEPTEDAPEGTEPTVTPTDFVIMLTDTPVPEPAPEPEPPTQEQLLAQAKAGRDTAIKTAMEQAIYNGIDVETSYGTEHFTLTTNDQTLLLGIYGMVQQGVTQYPYHSIGSGGGNNICVVYSDEDIGKIAVVAFGHITFHESYANMLLQWLNRETDPEVVQTIVYGATLPTDLVEYLAMILQSAGIDPSMIPGYVAPSTDASGEGTTSTELSETTGNATEEPVVDTSDSSSSETPEQPSETEDVVEDTTGTTSEVTEPSNTETAEPDTEVSNEDATVPSDDAAESDASTTVPNA